MGSESGLIDFRVPQRSCVFLKQQLQCFPKTLRHRPVLPPAEGLELLDEFRGQGYTHLQLAALNPMINFCDARHAAFC
jgi:hypothetical protein